MSFVLDNSVVIAWLLNEGNARADAIMERLTDATAKVPSVWPLEFTNALLVAERRARLTPAAATRLRELVLALRIEVVAETPQRTMTDTTALARTHGLSAYDASYLALALREGLPLATLDAKLAAAASALGVPML